jgi:hypothetical protein
VQTGISGWNLIDYVQVWGAEDQQTPAIPYVPGGAASVVYVPNTNEVGVDSFSYAASDCPGDRYRMSTPADVTLTILAVNDAPVGVTPALALSDVRRNELTSPQTMPITLTSQDVDNGASSLSFMISELPSFAKLHGVVAVGGSTEQLVSVTKLLSPVLHVVTSMCQELDFFRYTVSDGALKSHEATVNITMACLPSCEAGFEPVGFDSKDCRACSPGFHKESAGKGSCAACPMGTSAPQSGAVTCTACRGGTHQQATAGTSCTVCGVGKFQLVEGASQCLPCEPGHFQATTGATACEVCSPGLYQPQNGQSVCEICPFRLSSTQGSPTCNVCAAGFYRASAAIAASDRTCVSCPITAHCTSNTTLATLDILPGHWRLSTLSDDIRECIYLEGNTSLGPCLGGARSACQNGHSGPLCEICDAEGYHFDSDTADCTRCPKAGVAGGLMAGVVVMTFAAILGLSALYNTKAVKGTRLSIAKDALHVVMDVLATLGPTKGKMLVGFYQIIIAIEVTYNVDPIPDSYINAIAPFQFIGFDWSSLIFPADCLSGGFKSRLILVGLGPLVFMVATAALPVFAAAMYGAAAASGIYVSDVVRRSSLSFSSSPTAVRRSSSRPSAQHSESQSPSRQVTSDEEPEKNTCDSTTFSSTTYTGPTTLPARASSRLSNVSMGMSIVYGWLPFVLLVIFSFLPGVSSTAFSTWSCDRYKESSDNDVYYMNRDIAVVCNTDEHAQIKVVAWVFIIIWPVGMQLLWAGLLFVNREVLQQPHKTNALKKATAFLTGGCAFRCVRTPYLSISRAPDANDPSLILASRRQDPILLLGVRGPSASLVLHWLGASYQPGS